LRLPLLFGMTAANQPKSEASDNQECGPQLGFHDDIRSLSRAPDGAAEKARDARSSRGMAASEVMHTPQPV
jgi:hypothetical protein